MESWEGKVSAMQLYVSGEETMRAQMIQDYRNLSTNANATAEELRTELAVSSARCQFLQNNETALSDMLQLSESHACRLREAGTHTHSTTISNAEKLC